MRLKVLVVLLTTCFASHSLALPTQDGSVPFQFIKQTMLWDVSGSSSQCGYNNDIVCGYTIVNIKSYLSDKKLDFVSYEKYHNFERLIYNINLAGKKRSIDILQAYDDKSNNSKRLNHYFIREYTEKMSLVDDIKLTVVDVGKHYQQAK